MSQTASNYELVKLGEISEGMLKMFALSGEKDEIWLEIWAGGIYFRVVEKGKVLRESKLPMGKENKFDYHAVKTKLKGKVFINIKG